MTSASSAIAISTACGNTNIGKPVVVTHDRARVKEVEKSLQVSWHCYRRPVFERGGKPIGDCKSEFALTARTGSGSLCRAVCRFATSAAE